MTAATEQALNGLRDLSTLQWYVIPLLAIVFYVYTREMKEARRTGDWNAVLAALGLAIVPVLVLYLIFSRQLIRGITAGAVK